MSAGEPWFVYERSETRVRAAPVNAKGWLALAAFVVLGPLVWIPILGAAMREFGLFPAIGLGLMGMTAWILMFIHVVVIPKGRPAER